MLNALGYSAMTAATVNTTEGKRQFFLLLFFFFFFEMLEEGATDLRRVRVPPARG